MVLSANIDYINTSTTLSTKNDVYIIDASGGNIIITLPLITANGMFYNLKRIDADTTKTVTIQGTSGQLIDGISTFTLNVTSICEIQSYNLQWYITSKSNIKKNFGVSNFIFVNNNTNVGIPYSQYSNNANQWLSACVFLYKGIIYNQSSFNKITFLYNTLTDNNITYNIQLLIHGTLTIISSTAVTGSASTKYTTGIHKLYMTTFNNVPLTDAKLEFQIQLIAGGNNNAFNLYSIYIE